MNLNNAKKIPFRQKCKHWKAYVADAKVKGSSLN